jgi:hypothetical protein
MEFFRIVRTQENRAFKNQPFISIRPKTETLYVTSDLVSKVFGKLERRTYNFTIDIAPGLIKITQVKNDIHENETFTASITESGGLFFTSSVVTQTIVSYFNLDTTKNTRLFVNYKDIEHGKPLLIRVP